VSADLVSDPREARRQVMEDDLRLWHDVLATTQMAGRVWLFGGLLLGLVREGGLMLHDCHDADFAFHSDDVARLESCFPALIEAGFAPHYRFPGVIGDATEYSFSRGGAKFELFRIEVVGARFRYWNYGHGPDGPVKNTCSIPAQPLEEVRFLDRTWLKVRNHEAELTALYGDWRTPDPGYDYLRGPAIEHTERWDPSTFELWSQLYAA
jgi:hypothetical protein